MKYFIHHDQRVAYRKQGAGNPILFLHNGGTSHAIWQMQIDALASRYQVYAIDLPGYGQSSLPEAGYSLAAYTDTIEAFIDATLPSQRLTLVGNCMGSAIALNYAIRHPSQVHALVLVNLLTYTTFRQGQFGALLQLKNRAPLLSDAIAWGVRRMPVPEFAITPGILLQTGKQGHKSRLWENPALRESYKNPNEMPALTGLYNQLQGFSVLDQFKPEPNFPPIYTLWGEQNRVLSAQAGMQLNARLCPKETLMLQNCGHLLMLECPQLVNQVIETACA